MTDRPNSEFEIILQPAAQVVGIAQRTSNPSEMAGTGIIGKQWERFVRENLVTQIPDRADSAVVAVYTDYASDKDAEYTFLIGARVKSVAVVPQGMVAKTIPAGKYATFISERGPVERVVVETWQRIWGIALDRAYRADYEVYDERAADPGSAQVAIYVGIR